MQGSKLKELPLPVTGYSQVEDKRQMGKELQYLVKPRLLREVQSFCSHSSNQRMAVAKLPLNGTEKMTPKGKAIRWCAKLSSPLEPQP